MESKILLKITYDNTSLKKEVEKIIKFPYIVDSYTEFVFGHLHMHILWNGSGDSRENVFSDSENVAVPTDLGEQLPYINSVIKKYFKTEKIAMVRANHLFNCLLVPHRDYTEIEDGYNRLIRLHLPIHTEMSCLNSEEETVFHMKEGEIWMLNVSGVHAANCPTSFPRISIMIDFFCNNKDVASVFKDPGILTETISPTLIERQKMDDEFLNSLQNLSAIINEKNYVDIVQLLSKVHFYKGVPIRDFYDWLDEICEKSGNQRLVEKSKKLKSFFSIKRELNERFSYEVEEEETPITQA